MKYGRRGALKYLYYAIIMGSVPASEISKFIYKFSRSGMLDSRSLATVISRLDPYAKGIRLTSLNY
jgi:hypothetical protein